MKGWLNKYDNGGEIKSPSYNIARRDVTNISPLEPPAVSETYNIPDYDRDAYFSLSAADKRNALREKLSGIAFYDPFVSTVNPRDKSRVITFGEDKPELKYLRNAKFTQKAKEDVAKFAAKRNIDPNVLLSSMAIESPVLNASKYFNTHNLGMKMLERAGFPTKFKLSKDSMELPLEDLAMNAGAYMKDGSINYKKLDEKIEKWLPIANSIDSTLRTIESPMDAHALFLSEFGIDSVNPKQQVLPGVKESYSTMVKRGADYIRSRKIFEDGGSIPPSREIPEITVYGKKKYLQELDKQQQKYLADMAKYKQDSAAYQSYQDSLNLYTDVLDMANSEQNTYWNTRKKEIIDNYKRTAKGETVEYWKKAKAESKDADKSWYDQMIKKSIDEQKYYSNPKNIDKAIQDETKKHYNAFNIGTAYQLKTATNKNSNRYDYPDDGYFYTNMIRANNSSDREYKEYLNYFIKDRESELRDAIKSGKSQVSVSGMASTNIPGAKSEISNAKKLKKLLSSDIKPVGYTDSPESLRYPIYKKPVVEPPIATKPIRTNVKYDSTYENLQMRPLWATMAKQDTTSKIGTLNSLDPLYEKGFTYGEAQKFPEEIRKQYKLDYPIYKQGGIVPNIQKPNKLSNFTSGWLDKYE